MTKKSKPTFWERAEQYPPCLVRLLARHNYGRVLTDQEIAARSCGLPWQLVCALGQCTDWRGLDIYTMRLFLCGCGVDFENAKQMHRIGEYLRKTPSWRHLKMSPEWLTRWLPLIHKWAKAYAPEFK